MKPADMAATIPEIALCGTCGYPLRGLTELRCPECGGAFDPSNPRSMNLGRPLGRAARRALSPPGWPLASLALAAALLTLAAGSAPGGYFGLVLAAFALWSLSGGIWLLRVVAAAMVAVVFRARAVGSPRGVWRWCVLPAVALVTGAGARLDAPTRLCLWFSRPAMNRVAARMAPAAPGTRLAGREWVGAYFVEHIERTAAGVKFTVVGTGFLDTSGFEYSPVAVPVSVGELSYRSVGGGWYTWVESW